MKTYEVKKEELKGTEPICYGYKAIQWDSSTLQGNFNYGKNPVGKVFKVDGDISECSWGLHFSRDPAYVFNFYEPLGYNRYFKVAAYEKTKDSTDGLKTVAQCLEFLEEYDLIQFIDLIKKYDRSRAVHDSEAVHNSEAVFDSEAVSHSEVVRYSEAMSDSRAVIHSSAVRHSEAVSYSYAVSHSEAVSHSVAACNSSAVLCSRAVSHSEAVRHSEAAFNSSAVLCSNAVIHSSAVRRSEAVSNSNAVSDSRAVSRSYGVIDCTGIYMCAFCLGLRGGSYMLFNKQVSQDRANSVIEKIRWFKWYPKFENWYDIKGNKEWWAFCFPQLENVDNDVAWSKMPEEMFEYIKNLPEFDEDIWSKITGK